LFIDALDISPHRFFNETVHFLNMRLNTLELSAETEGSLLRLSLHCGHAGHNSRVADY